MRIKEQKLEWWSFIIIGSSIRNCGLIIILEIKMRYVREVLIDLVNILLFLLLW